MGSQERQAKATLTLNKAKWCPLVAFSRQLKLISHSRGELQTIDCLSREMEPLKDHPSDCEHLTNFINKPPQKQPGNV